MAAASACGLLLALGVAADRAHADTIPYGDAVHMEFNNKAPMVGQNIYMNYAPAGFNGRQSVFAGIYNWNPVPSAGANPWPLNSPFQSFCIDLKQEFTSGVAYTYTLTPLSQAPVDQQLAPGQTNPNAMGTTAAAELERLWGTDRSGVTTNITAAAFQVAIWAIVYDQSALQTILANNLTWSQFSADFNIGTNLKIGTKTTSLAFSLSSNTPNYQDTTTTVNHVTTVQHGVDYDADLYIWDALHGAKSQPLLAALSSDKYQDQLVVMPLPSAIWGGVALLAGLGVLTRRPAAS